MIEAYAFLAAFTVQILVLSVLIPAWCIGKLRVQLARLPAELLADTHPGFLTRYRALTLGLAVLGLLLLGWLFSDLRSADWNGGKAQIVAIGYFMAAFLLPLFLYGRLVVSIIKEQKSAEGKRTAILQRRGLFDFVSPFVVFLAVLAYFLFAAFTIYIEQHPFAGYAGALVNLGGITLVYAANAIALYVTLYGGKSPLETHSSRLHTIGVSVKSIVYSCILMVAFTSLHFSLGLLDLRSWGPFALSIFLAISAPLAAVGFTAPMRKPEAGGPGSDTRLLQREI